MYIKQALFLVAFFVILASCAPAVPYDQMPGGDLLSSAQGSQRTAEAAQEHARWQYEQLTATAQAPIIHITETAAAVAVQAAQAAGTGTAAIQTQVGAMTATAVWWTPTPNYDTTATVAALNAQNTALANQVVRDQLQLQREIRSNEFNRLLGPLAVIFGAVIILFLVMQQLRLQRYQPAHVDARGNVLPIMDLVEGSYIDIDRSPNFKGSMSNDLLIRLVAHMFEKKFGVPPQLPEVTAARQDATTERDQMIDLATRGLPGPTADGKERQKQAGSQAVKQLTDSALAKRYTIFDGATNDLTPINGEVIEHLDRDWQEAQA